MHESHLIPRRSIIGIGCTEYFPLRLSPIMAHGIFSGENSAILNFSGRKYAIVRSRFYWTENIRDDDDFSFLTLASVLRKKVDRMRNTKLSVN